MVENKTEFSLLGFKVRFRPDAENSVPAQEVVDLVLSKAKDIQDVAPQLNDGQLAILIALKLAEEKIVMEKEYKNNIHDLHMAAQEALSFINNSGSAATI